MKALHLFRLARRALLSLLALACCAGLVPPAGAGSLDEIRQRGKLVVGVKKDVPLWGQLDPGTGLITGLEPDLAQRIADSLGVRLELVGVQTADRIEALTSGRVDVLIATLSDTAERRKLLNLVQPHYYSSGANLLTHRNAGFKGWGDLRHRRVCGRRGAFYNRAVTVTYGADVVALYSNAWANAALRESRCAALLYDDTAIAAMLQDPAWSRDFTMPLPTILPAPWSIALSPESRGGALEQHLSALVSGWHRAGTLRELEKKWGIPPTRFVSDMHEAWTRKKDGRWYCGDQVSAGTPRDCL